jgi:hypothetical protein
MLSLVITLACLGADADRNAPPRALAASGDPTEFWAFQPIRRPALPEVKRREWVRTPIDAFILAGLEAAGLEPAPPADKTSLFRRVTFGLTGLPPRPEDIVEFLADSSPLAYDGAVERLLRSPQYGERWGRHWLDLVRFAETHSFERDSLKPFAWRYRDYVIESFNADKPLDRFFLEQLAGDELDERTAESIIATGYYRLGPWDDEPTDPLQARYDELDDMVSTTGQVFLGLTVNCARCHDHKIDPIPQADYYRLMAFFHNVLPTSGGDGSSILADVAAGADDESQRRELEALESQRRSLTERIDAMEREAVAKLPASQRPAPDDARRRRRIVARRFGELLCEEEQAVYKQLRGDLDTLEKSRRTLTARALCVKEGGAEAPETFVLVRGSAHARGERVEPGFPRVLGGGDAAIPPPAAGAATSGRRRALAQWIVDRKNPLTARVMANRIWQHHFGRGIVRSPNNFGNHGDAPTHPELLDWLASELIGSGWRMKHLHRLILGSSAYRMSSRPSEAGLAKDPRNDRFWRFDPRRLSAEEIRDAILAVNGKLNLKMGGPGFYTAIPAEVLQGQSRPGDGWGRSPEEERSRRSVYIHVKRSLKTPFLETFDLADTDASCPVRFATTQPTQALTMLNSEFMLEEAAALAARLRREAGDGRAEQVRLALRLALSRSPGDDEVQRGLRLIDDLEKLEGLAPEAALAQFCLMVYNLNEFIFLD